MIVTLESEVEVIRELYQNDQQFGNTCRYLVNKQQLMNIILADSGQQETQTKSWWQSILTDHIQELSSYFTQKKAMISEFVQVPYLSLVPRMKQVLLPYPETLVYYVELSNSLYVSTIFQNFTGQFIPNFFNRRMMLSVDRVSALGIKDYNIIAKNMSSSLYEPSYLIIEQPIADSQEKSLVIVIRGTNQIVDLVNDLSASAKSINDHYFHSGFYAVSEKFYQKVVKYHISSQNYANIVIVGHSYGAAIGAIITHFIHSEFQNQPVVAFLFGPPPSISYELAQYYKTKRLIFSFVLRQDPVPRLSLHCLRVFIDRFSGQEKICEQITNLSINNQQVDSLFVPGRIFYLTNEVLKNERNVDTILPNQTVKVGNNIVNNQQQQFQHFPQFNHSVELQQTYAIFEIDAHFLGELPLYNMCWQDHGLYEQAFKEYYAGLK